MERIDHLKVREIDSPIFQGKGILQLRCNRFFCLPGGGGAGMMLTEFESSQNFNPKIKMN